MCKSAVGGGGFQLREAASPQAKQKFQALADIALSRAEKLNALLSADALPAFPEVPADDLEQAQPPEEGPSRVAKPNDLLKPHELTLLAVTSKINGIAFVPFLKADLKERFAFPMPFW